MKGAMSILDQLALKGLRQEIDLMTPRVRQVIKQPGPHFPR